MPPLAELFATGRIVDVILALTIAEAVLLVGYRRWTGGGVPALSIVANLLAGACLLLAVRAALVGAAWYWVASALAASLVAHLADLNLRWTSGPRWRRPSMMRRAPAA